MTSQMVKPQHEGEDVTWKDVVFNIKPLWRLKFSNDENYHQLYDYLLLVKNWRNSEAHISPTATEQEIDAAINIVITMYFFASGSCITDLESNGHDIEEVMSESHTSSAAHMEYSINDEESEEDDDASGVDMHMAADRPSVKGLSEESRLEILKACITKLVNYSYSRKGSVFTKLRHWEAVYRIAADYGFVIDGDYAYFKRVIDNMHINHLPHELPANYLANSNTGIYANDIRDWNSEGLEGRALKEYEDIKKCADVFQVIVERAIEERKQ